MSEGQYNPMEEVKKWAYSSSSDKEGITFVRFLLKHITKMEDQMMALLKVEWFETDAHGLGGVTWYMCPWCYGVSHGSVSEHKPDCPRQAAVAFLEANEENS